MREPERLRDDFRLADSFHFFRDASSFGWGLFLFSNNKHEKSPDVSVEAWMRYCISAADIAALSSFPLRGAELVGIFRVSRIDRSSVAASA